MIENLASPGEIPEFYDVLDRRPVELSDSPASIEYIWIRGEFPHKGTVFNGITGRETFVEIYSYPGIKPRLIKNQYEVEENHPLYHILKERHDKNKATKIRNF